MKLGNLQHIFIETKRSVVYQLNTKALYLKHTKMGNSVGIISYLRLCSDFVVFDHENEN